MQPQKYNPHLRRQARRLLLQSLYEYELSQSDLKIIVERSIVTSLKRVDKDYCRTLCIGVLDHQGELNAAIEPHLDRGFSALDPIERALLRLSTYELCHRPEIPWRVVINEALELAKQFGAQDSHKYVNGVLEKIAKIARAVEIEAGK